MRTISLFAGYAVFLAAVAHDRGHAASPGTPAAADSAWVTTTMHDAAGHDLGTLKITDPGKGITITGMLHGLPPGTHGIHLHMVGKCDLPSFASAGAHWNPSNMQHGKMNKAGPHFGDLTNISVGNDSSVSVNVVSPGGTLKGHDMLLDSDGAALVIHAAADDYKTDPSGNSGARIACGIIRNPKDQQAK